MSMNETKDNNTDKNTGYRSPIINTDGKNSEIKKTKGQITFIFGIVFSALAGVSLISLFSGSLDGLGVAFFFATVALLFFAFSKIAKKRMAFILSSVACFVASVAILGSTSSDTKDLKNNKEDTASGIVILTPDTDSSDETVSNVNEEPVTSQNTEEVSESSTAETTTVSSANTSAPENSETSQQAAKTPISITSGLAFSRNEIATVSITAQPNTEYSITVYYPSGKSTAKGLENKTSDANGNVSWSWKIGGKTTEGEHYLIITGGGETIRKDFTVN